MTPSEICKASGLKSLDELSQISGVGLSTLHNWFKRKRFVFDSVLEKAVREKSSENPLSEEVVITLPQKD